MRTDKMDEIGLNPERDRLALFRLARRLGYIAWQLKKGKRMYVKPGVVAKNKNFLAMLATGCLALSEDAVKVREALGVMEQHTIQPHKETGEFKGFSRGKFRASRRPG